MIFHEIHSAYYNAVAKILAALVEKPRTEAELRLPVTRYGLGESGLTLLPALKSGRWPLMLPGQGEKAGTYVTPLRYAPTMPLTLTEKRWLKALLADPRIALFSLRVEGLEDVEPLFTREDLCFFDRSQDGDPYEEETYQAHFRLLLQAIREKRPIRLELYNRRGHLFAVKGYAAALEYSEKDDKFRLLVEKCPYCSVVNVAKIQHLRLLSALADEGKTPPRCTDTLVLSVTDERNALERCLLHFAHFEKQVLALGEGKYRLTLLYDKEDENELLIRILSFGPLVRVLAPASLVKSLRERLQKQKTLGRL